MKIKTNTFIDAGYLERQTYKILKNKGFDITISAVQAFSNFYDLIGRFCGYSINDINRAAYYDKNANKILPIPSKLRNFLIELIEKNRDDATWYYFAPDVKSKNLPKFIIRWVETRLNPAEYAFSGALTQLNNIENIDFKYSGGLNV